MSIKLKCKHRLAPWAVFAGAGIAIYSDVVTPQTAIGYAVAIGGFAFYNWAKMRAKAGPARCCSPRHRQHCEPYLLELNAIP
jgi:hypothetical protein